MKPKIEYIKSGNYQKLQPILKTAYEHNQFIAVIGDSGWGKSWNFDFFAKYNKNVFREEIESSMDTSIFFNTIIKKFKRSDLVTNKLFYAIRNASNLVKELKSKSMYIVDEAGNFKMSMHRNLRDFRKHTENHSSLVISGPNSFFKDLEKYAAKNQYGIKEFMTRINRWVFLDKPTPDELVSVFKVNGFDENLITELIEGCDNFRDVETAIVNYWIDNGINPELKKDVGLQA